MLYCAGCWCASGHLPKIARMNGAWNLKARPRCTYALSVATCSTLTRCNSYSPLLREHRSLYSCQRSLVVQWEQVLGEKASQEDAYAAAMQGVVQDLRLGVNASVIAYGQTGACAAVGGRARQA